MLTQYFRVTKPTLAIVVANGDAFPAEIPLGDIVTTNEVDIHCDLPVRVDWDGKRTLLFPQDLQRCCEKVKSAEVVRRAENGSQNSGAGSHQQWNSRASTH